MKLFLLLLLSCLDDVITITWIKRTNDGDKFDVTCSTCHLYGATCQSWSIFTCCKKCECSRDQTLFNGLCNSDISHKQLGCMFYTSNNQYYGLKTTTFFTSLTDISYIYRDGQWSAAEFYKCEFDDDQKYWDTIKWVDLFTGGRQKDDFYFDSNINGVMLKFFGTTRNKPLYSGLLIKFNIKCLSLYMGDVTSCLVVKVAGNHSYGSIVPTVATTTSTGKTIKPTTLTTSRLASTTKNRRKTTLPKSTQRSTKHQQPPTSSAHKHDNDDNNNTAQMVKEILPFVAAVLMVIAFCILFLCCKVRRGRHAQKTYKISLLTTNHPCYSGESSCEVNGELVTSCEFEIINQPSYSDVDELNIGILNEKKRSPSGIYYVNAITSDDKHHSVNSTDSDFAEQNQQSTSNNIFLVDDNT